MKHLIFSFLILFSFHFTYSQSAEDKQKAHDLCMQGIEQMDKGEIEKAIEFFEQAKAIDPDNIYYPYEIAHSHFLTKQYKKSIQILNPLLVHNNVTDHVYHLLGRSYELSKNPSKAISIYNSGLERFPKSGILYNALGNYHMKKHDYKEALNNFEKGIAGDPDFSQNYYWASKVHASLEDKLWGIMYAELFINMEGVNDQSLELEKMIYDVYLNGTKISSDTVLIDLADSDTTYKNFEAEFEKVLSESASSLKEINIANISAMRKTFLNKWIDSGNNNKYPNLLFDWQEKILLEGYWEDYHYWLLKEGNPGEFQDWSTKNEAHYNEFVEWLSKNYLVPSPTNYFVTTQYSN